MAIAYLAPCDDDLVSLDEALDLLRETPHPVSKSTLRRWLHSSGRSTRRIAGTVYVSYTDVLEVHRDEIHRRLDAGNQLN